MKCNRFSASLIAALATTAITIIFPLSALASQHKTITLFLPNTNWPPYLIHNEQGPEGGLFAEILEKIAEPMGYNVIVKFLPDKRGWLLLDAGDVDAHVKAKEWVAEPEKYYWTDPFLLSEDVLLYSRDCQIQYDSPESLYGRHVAAIESFVYPALESHFRQKNIYRVNVSFPCTMLDLLEYERVDAAIVNRAETKWLMRFRPDLGIDRFRMDETPLGSAEYRYLFTRKQDWQPFIDDFNQALRDMKKDGRLKAIIDKYQ